MLYATGDTHGEIGRFEFLVSAIEKTLTKDDKLFICGDFGYIMNDSFQERKFLDFLAQKEYQILWVDGNHENFELLNEYGEEIWCGGKVHVIRRDNTGAPKIIHLMRGQIFEIESKTIFTMGGGFSRDKIMRTPYKSWWPQEMPNDLEFKEAIINLEKHSYTVDYILTHTAPKSTLLRLKRTDSSKEEPLNNFLEWIRENTSYTQWYFGHFHLDEETWFNQTAVWFALRNMQTNEIISEI